MFAVRHPVENEAVDELTGEPHPDPASGDHRRRELLWHEVVERSVEVWQRHLDGDPGNRVDGAATLAPAPGPLGASIAVRPPGRSPLAGSRRWRRTCHRPESYQTPPTPSVCPQAEAGSGLAD